MNKKIFLILGLIAILAILTAYIYFAVTTEKTMTVELFENGTRINVPESMKLESYDELATVYSNNKSTVYGMDTSNFFSHSIYSILVSMVQEVGVFEDGFYKIDENAVRQLNEKMGNEVPDSFEIKECYVKIVNNNSLNQSIIIVGVDKAEIEKMADSIVWKEANTINNASMNQTIVEEPVYDDTTADTSSLANNTTDKPVYDNADGIGLSDEEYSKQHQKEIDAYQRGLEDAGYFDKFEEEDESDDALLRSSTP